MRWLGLFLLFVPLYAFAVCIDHTEYMYRKLDSAEKVIAFMQEKPASSIRVGIDAQYEVELADPNCLKDAITKVMITGVKVVEVYGLTNGKSYSGWSIDMDELLVVVLYKSANIWERNYRDAVSEVESWFRRGPVLETSSDTASFQCPLKKRYEFKQRTPKQRGFLL